MINLGRRNLLVQFKWWSEPVLEEMYSQRPAQETSRSHRHLEMFSTDRTHSPVRCPLIHTRRQTGGIPQRRRLIWNTTSKTGSNEHKWEAQFSMKQTIYQCMALYTVANKTSRRHRTWSDSTARSTRSLKWSWTISTRTTTSTTLWKSHRLSTHSKHGLQQTWRSTSLARHSRTLCGSGMRLQWEAKLGRSPTTSSNESLRTLSTLTSAQLCLRKFVLIKSPSSVDLKAMCSSIQRSCP